MEITLESIIGILSLFIGGSGGAFFTWRYAKKKAKAEASSAEFAAVQAAMTATKDMQESYRQMVTDVNQDREDQRQYIHELKEDRRHLRAERDELRDRQDKLDQAVRDLRNEVAKMGRKIKFMGPLICGRKNCPNRVIVPELEIDITDMSTSSPSPTQPTQPINPTSGSQDMHEIEPYNED